jgi:hypothetical protein
MGIDQLTGVIAVLIMALLFFLWPPPDDDNGKGPGETAP